MKKILSLLLCLSMLLTMGIAVSAKTRFEDVNPSDEILVEAVDLLDYIGVAKGKTETYFGADEVVTREQFALFIYRLMNRGKDAPKTSANTTKFTDLENETYFYAIGWAVNKGIIAGRTETIFDPKAPITLQEAFTMVTRALDWDNGLQYPYGFIDVAEQAGVRLDRGLDADIDYTDYLTRGDMAIILYNAFFAETGEEVVEQIEIKIGNDNNATWVLKEVTVHKTLCEVVFDAVEVRYQIMATPNFQMEGYEATADLGYDAVYLSKVSGAAGPHAVYASAADLGLDGKQLDTYFLSEVTTFVTLDDKGNIDKFLYANPVMNKMSVNDVTVVLDKDDVATGKIVADESAMYVFDAPYTYANATYPVGATKQEQYDVRNEKNLKAIVLTNVDGIFEASIIDIVDAVDIEEGFAAQAEQLVDFFYADYCEADFYDVNGDGVYDYVRYIPYTFFQVDIDEDMEFADSDFDALFPVIYTEGATAIGKFDDKDYVIGYFDADLGIVKVADTLEVIKAQVTKFNTKTNTITLSTGDKVYTLDGKYFTHAIKDEPAKNYIIYDGNLIGETDYIAAPSAPVVETKFTSPIAVLIDGEVINTFDPDEGTFYDYTKVWFEETNSIKYVPIKEVAEVGIPYTYSIDKDGLYEFKAINIQLDPAVLIGPDNGKQVAIYDDIVRFEKIAGNRYYINDQKVEMDVDTRVIIRIDNSWKIYKLADFNKNALAANVTLTNVTAVYANNAKSITRENLVFIYAEAASDIWAAPAEPDVSEVLHIVNTWDTIKVDDKWAVSYEVYNLSTKKLSTAFGAEKFATAKEAAESAENFASGAIVVLKGDVIFEKRGQIIEEDIVFIGDNDIIESRIKVAPTKEDLEDERVFTVTDFITGDSISTDGEGYVKYDDKTIIIGKGNKGYIAVNSENVIAYIIYIAE